MAHLVGKTKPVLEGDYQKFRKMWPLLVTLLWAESEANVMLLLLHKVNGRFSINHRTTNTGMASAAMANGNRSVIHRPTLSTFEPRFAINLGVVGPISAPHPSFLI